MAELSQVDRKRLWEIAQKGHSAKKIRQEFDIRNMTGLQQILQEVMRETGESVVVPGLVGRVSVKAQYTDAGILISPQMLRDTGFKPGDEFNLKVTDSGLALEKR